MYCEIPSRMRTKSHTGMAGWLEEGRVRSDCEKAFQAADDGQKGYLTAEDYKVAVLSLLGYKPSKYEVATVWQAWCQGQQEEGLQREAFISLMTQRLRRQDRDDVTRQVFLTFDARCQGFITEDDCARAFRQVAPHMAVQRVPGLFREVDRNGDGRVSYRDFELMMQYSQPHTDQR